MSHLSTKGTQLVTLWDLNPGRCGSAGHAFPRLTSLACSERLTAFGLAGVLETLYHSI